jgi:hypothetical protein
VLEIEHIPQLDEEFLKILDQGKQFKLFRWQSSEVINKTDFKNVNIVTDLINALPGNGSVNTVQHAIIEQRVYATRF